MTDAPPIAEGAPAEALRAAKRWPRGLLALTVGLVSACSMAVEIVAGRAIAPYVGMSLYSWTIIIAVVLAGLSIGHWLGGVAADRADRPARMIALSLLGAAATTIVSLPILTLLNPALDGAAPLSRAGALTLAAFFAPSFFAGLLSPMLTQLALEASAPATRGRVLGLFYALGAGGAILGTLVAGLALISWLGSATSMLAISLVYAALALPFLAPQARPLAAAGCAALAMLSANAGQSPCDRESSYYCIQVDDLSTGGLEARVLALDHLAHGLNDATDPRNLLATYVHGVDELIARRFPGPALEAYFIGGGAFSLPRAWLSRYPEGRMLVAELDEAVTETAHRQLWLPNSRRLQVVHQDARQALGALPSERRFDVIFGDAFHDISIPQHLVTDEFHREIKARLKPGGVYAINVVDLLRAPRFMLSLATTLQSRFAAVELWIDFAEIGPQEKRTTWIVLASDSPSAADRIAARYGPAGRWVRVPLEAMKRAPLGGPLVTLSDDYSPVDRLLAGLLLDASAAER